MSKQVKIRRGTAAEHASFTGVVGEVTVDTTNDSIRVHNGSTVGGRQMARADGVNASGSWPINVTGNAATATNLSGTLAVANGGTGATTASAARSNLSAAASGANTDITALDQDVTITATGTIAANSIGYRGLPQESKTANYTLALADAGKHISITTGTVTIPANGSIAFPVGTTIVIYNNASSTRPLAITTDTLRQAGTANTGTRTIAQYGLATCVKVASTTWVVSGSVT
jgi:hypothetical protein